MNHWLFKSEPSTFGIDDLAKLPKQTTAWDGVRNYQARNMLRDTAKTGDLVFFYHSSCEVPGVAGIVKIVKAGYPDASAWDKKNPHYDMARLEKAPAHEIRWDSKIDLTTHDVVEGIKCLNEVTKRVKMEAGEEKKADEKMLEIDAMLARFII